MSKSLQNSTIPLLVNFWCLGETTGLLQLCMFFLGSFLLLERYLVCSNIITKPGIAASQPQQVSAVLVTYPDNKACLMVPLQINNGRKAGSRTGKLVALYNSQWTNPHPANSGCLFLELPTCLFYLIAACSEICMQCRCCMWLLLALPGLLHRVVMVSIAESSCSNSKKAKQERACKATEAEAASPLLCSPLLSDYILPSATSTHHCSTWGFVHGSTV